MELYATNSNQQVISHIHENMGINNAADNSDNLLRIMDISEHHFWLRMFLIMTANHWPQGSSGFALLCKCHWVFARFAIMIGVCFALYYCVAATVYAEDAATSFFLPIYIALLLAGASVLPTQHVNRRRLSAPLIPEEKSAVDDSLIATSYFAAAAALCSLATIIVTAIWTNTEVQAGNSYFLALGLAVPHLYVALALTFNMFFFMLDLHTSAALLNQLHMLANQRLLVMDKFNALRTAISDRSRASRWASDFILIPCIASAVGIAVAVMLIDRLSQGHAVGIDDDDSHGNNTVIELQVVGSLLSLTKELIYLFVAFWYVARVNEQADELTVKLSKGFWGKHNMCDVESEHSPDMHRLSIHTSSMSEPITYSLLFKRVSKQNVLLSAAGLCFTILVGIIRSSVTE